MDEQLIKSKQRVQRHGEVFIEIKIEKDSVEMVGYISMRYIKNLDNFNKYKVIF